jgi:uncharacterized DUF497 family protein
MDFEWDEEKAAYNQREHGVSFAFATKSFRDQRALEKIDDRQDYEEERIIRTGYASDKLLTVVYTERNEAYRLISARIADKNEQDEYFCENAI